MPVNAVVFDAFGTLFKMPTRRSPLVRLASKQPNRRYLLESLMTNPWDLQTAFFKMAPQGSDYVQFHMEIAAELASISLIPEATGVLSDLQSRGLKIGIASNLAAYYAPSLIELLPFALDAYAWSFELGCLKPNPRFFSALCRLTGLESSEILMVGDSFISDYRGAASNGLIPLLLDTAGTAGHHALSISSLREVIMFLDEY